MKGCTRCKSKLPEHEFHKNKNRKDGLAAWCKGCTKFNTRRYYSNLCPKKRLEYKRGWNCKNREHLNRYNEEWRKKNPDKHTHRQALRRANKNRATPNWLTEAQKKQIQSIYTSAKAMESKFGLKYHVDHIVPLNGKNVCGLHVPWNLQLLEASLNIRKGNSYVDVQCCWTRNFYRE